MDIYKDMISYADKYIFRCLVLHHRTDKKKLKEKRHNVIQLL